MTETERTAQLDRLKQLIEECQGDVKDAVRGLCGCTTTALAERLGFPYQTVEACLRVAENRRYPHVRRAIEAELNLPVGSLDKVLHVRKE